MTIIVGMLLLAASISGCAFIRARGPVSPAPDPPSASVPSGPPAPQTPPAPPAPPTSPPPAVVSIPREDTPPAAIVSPRVEDEVRLTQEVSSRLADARRIVAQIDLGKLTRDQREIFTSIQDFLVKAEEAITVKDLPRAQILANKASKLAEDLAATAKKSK